jgi:hypothetical protein
MKKTDNIALVLLLSALTGGIVGGSLGLAASAFTDGVSFPSLGFGLLIGAFIGLAAGGAFTWMSSNAGRRPLLSFFMVALTIAVGTAAGNLAGGLPPGVLFYAVVMGAEVLGLAATFFWYRSYRRWNGRLRDYRRRRDADPKAPDAGPRR